MAKSGRGSRPSMIKAAMAVLWTPPPQLHTAVSGLACRASSRRLVIAWLEHVLHGASGLRGGLSVVRSVPHSGHTVVTGISPITNDSQLHVIVQNNQAMPLA